MKKLNFLFATVVAGTGCFLQTMAQTEKPKLVIGIVVDQMRADYLERFKNNFGNDGFNRLVREGMVIENCHYNYVPTETAPGHASIYTGATPSVHGIVGNAWWSNVAKKSLSSVQEENNPTRLSPNKLLIETVTDRFKNSFTGSRVYSISLKDRGAILPGGKKADAAFWYDDVTGKFISSEYYPREKITAKWVTDFNNKNYAKQFLKNGWKKTEGHVFEFPDSTNYEGVMGKNKNCMFPYVFDSAAYGDLKYTSWGNKLVSMFATEAFNKEKLGQGKSSDFLCISFSSTDYVGHRFGINSVELEQIYIDLDKDIESLLKLFDEKVGKNNYLLFLTADHGAVSNPQFLCDHGLEAGTIITDTLKLKLMSLAGSVSSSDSLILDYGGDQIKFNDALIKTKNLNKDSLLNVFTDFLECQPGVAVVLTSTELEKNKYSYGIRQMMQNGFRADRNADIQFVLKPNWLVWGTKKGTSHGTPYAYDTHVPLVFFGHKIKPGKSAADVKITDIAPTVSKLIGMELPAGVTGKNVDAVER